MCLPPIPLHASLILAVALPSFRAPLKCVDYSFRVTQVESKHTYSESILLLLLHSVSLQMRNKGLIIPNDLPPSFCQFGLYVLFIAREKQNKTIQKYSPYSVKDFFFPLIKSRFLFHKLKLNTSDIRGVSLWTLCSLLILNTFYFPMIYLPSIPSNHCACNKTQPGIYRMFYTCTHQNTESIPFSLDLPLSILSSNSYFPSLSPFITFWE